MQVHSCVNLLKATIPLLYFFMGNAQGLLDKVKLHYKGLSPGLISTNKTVYSIYTFTLELSKAVPKNLASSSMPYFSAFASASAL